jgi:hypothetical protein
MTRKLDRYLLPQEIPALFIGSVRQHYDGMSTDTLQRVYQFLFEHICDNSIKMEPVTRKIYEIEWQIVRKILIERGVVA